MWDFEKNKVVDSLEAVPEKFRGLYEEITEGDEAGKFTIAAHAHGIVADYTGAMASLTNERGKAKKLGEENTKRRLASKAFEELCESLGLDEEGRTAEGLKAFIDELVGKAKNGEELKVSIENVRREMAKKHEAELAAKDQEIGARDKSLEKHLISDRATQAIATHKGKHKVLMPHIKAHTKVVKDPETGDYMVRVVGDDGEVRFNGQGAPMSVGDFVEELKNDQDFAGNFESESKGGGGALHGTNKQITKPAADKTSTDKIAAGLSKGGGTAGRRFGIGA